MDNANTGTDMNKHTHLPSDNWTLLVDALLDARADHLDPRNAIILALAEVGFIVPDSCREEEEPAPVAA